MIILTMHVHGQQPQKTDIYHARVRVHDRVIAIARAHI